MVITWNEWLEENLRPDQFAMLDAYDVQILAHMHSRMKRLKKYEEKGFKHLGHLRVDASTISQDVHLEMGGLTEAQFDERLRKLEDMALIRRQLDFNRLMPDDFYVG